MEALRERREDTSIRSNKEDILNPSSAASITRNTSDTICMNAEWHSYQPPRMAGQHKCYNKTGKDEAEVHVRLRATDLARWGLTLRPQDDPADPERLMAAERHAGVLRA